MKHHYQFGRITGLECNQKCRAQGPRTLKFRDAMSLAPRLKTEGHSFIACDYDILAHQLGSNTHGRQPAKG